MALSFHLLEPFDVCRQKLKIYFDYQKNTKMLSQTIVFRSICGYRLTPSVPISYNEKIKFEFSFQTFSFANIYQCNISFTVTLQTPHFVFIQLQLSQLIFIHVSWAEWFRILRALQLGWQICLFRFMIGYLLEYAKRFRLIW